MVEKDPWRHECLAVFLETQGFEVVTERPDVVVVNLCRRSTEAAEAVPHEGTHPTHSYAAGSPTTDGKRLYVSFGSFGIFTKYSLMTALSLYGTPFFRK